MPLLAVGRAKIFVFDVDRPDKVFDVTFTMVLCLPLPGIVAVVVVIFCAVFGRVIVARSPVPLYLSNTVSRHENLLFAAQFPGGVSAWMRLYSR